MGLDIRWPIGLMFSLIGVLLTGFGALDSKDSLALGININFDWGLVLLAFALLMLAGPVWEMLTARPKS